MGGTPPRATFRHTLHDPPILGPSTRIAALLLAALASAALVWAVFTGWAWWVALLYPDDDSPVPVYYDPSGKGGRPEPPAGENR